MKTLSNTVTKRGVLAALFLALLNGSVASASGLVVIANPDSGLEKLSREEVVQYFMGRLKKLPAGGSVSILDVQPLRAEFYRVLLGKDVAEINAYWARLKFSGQTSPPLQLDADSAALERVARDKTAITYIDEHRVDKRVRVVLKLDH